MAKEYLVLNDRFFELVEKIEKVASSIPVPIEDIASKEDEKLLVDAILLLNEMGLPISLQKSQDKFVILKEDSINLDINIKLSFSEWLALQAQVIFDKSHDDKKFKKTLKNKFRSLVGVYPIMSSIEKSLFENSKTNACSVISEKEKEKISKIESAIIDKSFLKIVLQTGVEIDICPFKIVYLEGGLCLVGENLQLKLMDYTPLREISGISILKKDYLQNLSKDEVNDFLEGMRVVNGSHVRLIMKIIHPEKIDLSPPYHFLSNTFMTANQEGELIWAANVESGPDLFNWLYCLKDSIVILDPSDTKMQFEEFCLSKKIKQAG